MFWNDSLDICTSVYCSGGNVMKKCPNCKGENITELVWGYPSKEFLEKSVNENDDLFVKIAAMIGGDDYLKVARSLQEIQHRTEEEISKSTGLSIFRVRRALFDMFGKGIIEGVRTVDKSKENFVYRWHSNKKKIMKFIKNNHLSAGSGLIDYPEFSCDDCNEHFGHQRFN